MVKFLFTTILICICLANYAQQCARCKATCKNCKQDSINVILSNPYKDNFVTIDTISINLLTDKFKKPKESFDPTKWFSLLFTLIGLPFIYFNFLRTGRFKNFDFLSEVDKQLIANPQLWCIYDKKKKKYTSEPEISLEGGSKILVNGIESILFEKEIALTAIADNTIISSPDDFVIADGSILKKLVLINGVKTVITPSLDKSQSLKIDGAAKLSNCSNITIQTQTDKEIDDKVEAFCYYKLNNFENVFKNFGWVKSGNVFESWERYLIEIMITSTAFNIVVAKALKRDYLSERFSARLVKYQSISNALKENHEKFENDEIKKEAYKKYYDEEINKQFKKEIFLSKALFSIFILGILISCFLIIRELINHIV